MGKDNIVFHAQIWPAELLAYNGKGSRGGNPGKYGELNLPTEVVSSEFLTMEGKQFSTSRSVVIYVRDVLDRYQADALRYFICAAGPETSDSDFTWAEFVRRTNGELVAGWGNLVNRTATMVHTNFGSVPEAGELTPDDVTLLAAVDAGFGSVGELLARHRFRQAIAEAMRIVGEVNKYVTAQEPYKLKAPEQRERLATILHVTTQAVVDCNTMLAPFLPHAANRVHRVLGGEGDFVPMPRIEEVEDLDGGPGYPIITGEYADTPTWGRHVIEPGRVVDKPTPVFTKLDPSVVDEELARLERDAGVSA
jgi:methionyl-tRNA synthetase